jgi:hypothetical protein
MYGISDEEMPLRKVVPKNVSVILPMGNIIEVPHNLVETDVVLRNRDMPLIIRDLIRSFLAGSFLYDYRVKKLIDDFAYVMHKTDISYDEKCRIMGVIRKHIEKGDHAQLTVLITGSSDMHWFYNTQNCVLTKTRFNHLPDTPVFQYVLDAPSNLYERMVNISGIPEEDIDKSKVEEWEVTTTVKELIFQITYFGRRRS